MELNFQAEDKLTAGNLFTFDEIEKKIFTIVTKIYHS